MDEKHIGFLVYDVARQMRYRFDGKARALGVTRQQWRLLMLLARKPGETQAALADDLEVERITLCRMIDRLQDAELLERRADPADRRVWRIFLTPKGEAVNEKLQSIGLALHEEMLSVLHPEEEKQLQDLLSKLREALSKRIENLSAIA